MLHFWKNLQKATDAAKIMKRIRKNAICIELRAPKEDRKIRGSRFGGRPAVPEGFEWPRFEAQNGDGVRANRPLSFLCQIDLEDVTAYDRDRALPRKGLLLFFYEMESMNWGFDAKDVGCSGVYFIEDPEETALADYPEDLKEEYRMREYGVSFEAKDSYPGFEELERHIDICYDNSAYDGAIEKSGYVFNSERHKLLGYADLIQGEMTAECERIAGELYRGDRESDRGAPDDARKDVLKHAAEWTLLFQMASIRDENQKWMFGDDGDLYFYIRKADLAAKRFDRIWAIQQCY